MKTDSLFYELFQKFPDALFAMTGQSTDLAGNYRFTSESVKQTAFTMDGVFMPIQPELPIYFVEVQFQKDEDLCSRMFTEIMLFLRDPKSRRDWRAVIIVPTRSLAPRIEPTYEIFAPRLTIVCLKELGESENLGVELARLITAPKHRAPAQAKKLLRRTVQVTEPQAQAIIQDFVGTIMVYKFPKLSRQELEAMLELGSIEKTRVYQEALEEGEAIGELRGEREALLRLLTRKFGALPQKLIAQLNAVTSKVKLDQLLDLVLDATTLEDFLQNSKS